MQYFHPSGLCHNCHIPTPERAVSYPIFRLGYILCESCESRLQQRLARTTEETILLYFALRAKKLPAELQRVNGHSKMDIAVAPARINIEVSAVQQVNEDELLHGFLTLNIPDASVRNDLTGVINYIEKMISKNHERILM